MNSTTCDARNEARPWLMTGPPEDTDVDEAVDQDEASTLYDSDGDDAADEDDDDDEDDEDDEEMIDEDVDERVEVPPPATDDEPASR